MAEQNLRTLEHASPRSHEFRGGTHTCDRAFDCPSPTEDLSWHQGPWGLHTRSEQLFSPPGMWFRRPAIPCPCFRLRLEIAAHGSCPRLQHWSLPNTSDLQKAGVLPGTLSGQHLWVPFLSLVPLLQGGGAGAHQILALVEEN